MVPAEMTITSGSTRKRRLVLEAGHRVPREGLPARSGTGRSAAPAAPPPGPWSSPPGTRHAARSVPLVLGIPPATRAIAVAGHRHDWSLHRLRSPSPVPGTPVAEPSSRPLRPARRPGRPHRACATTPSASPGGGRSMIRCGPVPAHQRSREAVGHGRAVRRLRSRPPHGPHRRTCSTLTPGGSPTTTSRAPSTSMLYAGSGPGRPQRSEDHPQGCGSSFAQATDQLVTVEPDLDRRHVTPTLIAHRDKDKRRCRTRRCVTDGAQRAGTLMV